MNQWIKPLSSKFHFEAVVGSLLAFCEPVFEITATYVKDCKSVTFHSNSLLDTIRRSSHDLHAKTAKEHEAK